MKIKFVLLDLFFWKRPQLGPFRPLGPRSRAPAGPSRLLGPRFRASGVQIQGPSWGPRGPWGPNYMEWYAKKNTFFSLRRGAQLGP